MYFTWDAGAQTDENFTVFMLTPSLKKMRILPFPERVRHGDFIFIYERSTRCLRETVFSKKQIFFFNVWIYLRWELCWIKHDTRMGSMCVCCTWWGRGGSFSWACCGDHWVSHLSHIFIHRWPIPSLTDHNQTSYQNNLFKNMSCVLTLSSCQWNRVNVLIIQHSKQISK